MRDNSSRPRHLTRRNMLALAGLAVGTGIAAPARAAATIPGSEKRCATCNFWTGPRQVSADGASVVVATAETTGTCTNPNSPLFQKQSRATQGFAAGHARWTALK